MKESLVELLDEPVESVRHREQHGLEDLLRKRDNRVVLFGCGNLGTQAARALRGIGITPLAFTDNNRARWGSKVEGLEVLPPVKAVEIYGKNATFLVTIWNVLHWYHETFQQLREYGADQVAPFVLVHWRFPELFLPFLLNDLPHKVYEERESVLRAEGIWADEASRSTYAASVKMRALGNLNELPGRPEENTYFPRDLFFLQANESLLDCGAFDGDTLRQALEAANGAIGEIHAVEADSISFARLETFANELPPALRDRIHLYRCAVGLERGVIRFEATGTVDSKISDRGELVDVYSIDELFRDRPLSFIKMDIEGAEFDALRGGRKVIERDRPLLAICVYHTQNDIWRIPLLIREMLPEHRLFLRAYEGDGFQTVVYAVPPQRMVMREAA